jgi:hypothetical protein
MYIDASKIATGEMNFMQILKMIFPGLMVAGIPAHGRMKMRHDQG